MHQYNSDCGDLRTLLIVLELADRGTFAKVISEEATNKRTLFFQESNIMQCLLQLSSALSTLHKMTPAPILHRALKPDNILGFTDQSNGGIVWKLPDFDTSKMLTESHASSDVGTALYKAPEVNIWNKIFKSIT